jgi:hypothetical protein
MGGRKLLAKWVSGGYKQWCELYRVTGSEGLPDYVTYASRNGMGCIGSINPMLTEEMAVSIMQDRIDRGWFVPDSAVLPLKRVA